MRNYDPQIGRWIQQDPFQQFASPYVGMGDDPVNNIDPSGGDILPVAFKIGGEMSKTAATAINLTGVVVRSVSTAARTVSTLSTVMKVANITSKVYQVANIINSSLTSLQVGGLTIGGDKNQAFLDLRCILPDGLWGDCGVLGFNIDAIISVDGNGRIRFDLNAVPSEFKDDPGIRVLDGMVNGSERYQYNVSDYSKYALQRYDPATKQPIGPPFDPKQQANLLKDPFTGVDNLSKTPLLEISINFKTNRVPFDADIDGEVTISGNVTFYEPPLNLTAPYNMHKSRASVVLHELIESYRKTTGKEYYWPAHNGSAREEKSLPDGDSRRSRHPGEGSIKPPN